MQVEISVLRAFMNDYLNRSGRTVQQLANEVGYTRTQTSRIVNGQVPGSTKFWLKIKELKDREALEQEANTGAPQDISHFAGIPVVSWARAGESVDYEDLCSQIDDWIQFDTKDPNAFALIIEGDSMEPRFPAGEFIIVEPNRMPRNGGYVAAKLKEGGGVMFKKYRVTGPEGTVIIMESENPNYAPKEYSRDDFEWIYAVGGAYRKFN